MPSDLVMHKYKHRKLHSGSKHGPLVNSRKQAIAIMLSEKRNEDEHGGEYQEGAESKEKRKKIQRRAMKEGKD